MGIKSWKEKAARLQADVFALSLAFKDPRTPWYARILVVGIVAYALSPIDLIPDFIPVLGYLDDLVVLPAGVYLVVKLVPAEVMEECRRRAGQKGADTGFKWLAAALVAAVWLLLLFLVIRAIS